MLIRNWDIMGRGESSLRCGRRFSLVALFMPWSRDRGWRIAACTSGMTLFSAD
jgi:hypothetical protein